MSPTTKCAAVQIDPKLMKKEKNLQKILLKIREAVANGVRLIVFPECVLTGYVFSSREETAAYAETIPGPATEAVTAVCRELDVYVIFGLLEKDDDRLYNAAALVGPGGLIGKYRKTHLYMSGLDRFVDAGDMPLEVHRTPVGNVGILMYHDLDFPEPARVLMSKGADILAVPANWPCLTSDVPRPVVTTRAVENLVHVVAANRVGTERNVTFLGQSKIVNAVGRTKIDASMTGEEIIYAEIDLAFARQKHPVFTTGVLRWTSSKSGARNCSRLSSGRTVISR